jgi:hypothetical protein
VQRPPEKKVVLWVYKTQALLKEVEFDGVDWIQLAPGFFSMMG